MGELVKILGLATNLIILSGLRPRQKLYEEVAAMEDSTLPTSYEKIMVFPGASALPAFMLERLGEVCASRDVWGLVLLFKELVPEYDPSVQILSKAFNGGRARVAVQSN